MLRHFPYLLLLACMTGCSGLTVAPGPSGASDDAASISATSEGPYVESAGEVSGRARQRFDSATAAMAAGDWAAARAHFEWLVETYPALSGPYLNLALLDAAEGNTAGAEAWFQAALEVNGTNLEAYNQYAIFLRRAGRFEEAETVYLAALDVWEAHPGTHRNLGVLYDLYRGDGERALQHYYRYQVLTGETDRTVAGWIIDLERRYGQVVQVGGQ